jgi:hypothetical protein
MSKLQWSARSTRYAGFAAIVGGVLAIMLAPIMVIVKYMTGWSVIAEPAWIRAVQPALDSLLSSASPVGLWVTYGRLYTLALVLMFLGLLALYAQTGTHRGRIGTAGYWVLLLGLCLVIPGDAVHTATWHQNGLTTPTPGTNVVANTAYATHMMGMNFVMVGSLMVGISALRKKFLAPWLAWLFVLILPSAVIASVTLLPTTPSGALWLFSLMMIAVGYSMAAQKSWHLLFRGGPDHGVFLPAGRR